jgi:L-seryl-tRNA(Ser) seleniumtransferase
VIESAHARGIPVVVDAAAQLPPAANLWRFTRDLGADLAIFSGGKGIQGPQPTGLVVGRADLIEGIYPNAVPNPRIGRPMKVGKEELFGILAAVEWYLAQDEPTTLRRYEEIVQLFVEGLNGLPGVIAERDYPSEAGQPHPRCLVTLDSETARVNRDELMRLLWEGDPCIAVAGAPDGGIWPTRRPPAGAPVGAAKGEPTGGVWLNPQTLAAGEEQVVLRRLREVLA